MKVTRIAYSKCVNPGKYAQLEEQARRLGRVRTLVWDRHGSLAGAGVKDRTVRDAWLKDGTADTFGVLANAWKETVRDAMADITAHRAAAKLAVRKAVWKRTDNPAERKRLFSELKYDRYLGDPYLSRMMRRRLKRGHNHTHNQIVVRCDQYKAFTLAEGGNVWLAVPGLHRRNLVKIPLDTTVAPTGTLRLILRSGLAEVHYAIDAATMKTSKKPCGTATIGVDKGYTEVLVDSDGNHHGERLGALLRAESDHLRTKNARRAKLRSVQDKARERGDQAVADRIKKNNLGTVKKNRRRRSFEQNVRTLTFTAVHAVVDKAARVVAEDLSQPFVSRKRLGKNTNRRLAMWTKGVTAEALSNVSERRGSALTLVNAAYTSQVVPCCRVFGQRKGDRLHCTSCGVVWQADHAGAINVLERYGDPDISLYTSHTRVKHTLQERADRRRTILPVQDSSPTGGERIIRTARQRAMN